jgi:hypothetical protein
MRAGPVPEHDCGGTGGSAVQARRDWAGPQYSHDDVRPSLGVRCERWAQQRSAGRGPVSGLAGHSTDTDVTPKWAIGPTPLAY